MAGERYICTLQNVFKASSDKYYEVPFDGRKHARLRIFFDASRLRPQADFQTLPSGARTSTLFRSIRWAVHPWFAAA